MTKQFYIYNHITAISLGFGGGYVKEIKAWDFSISLLFWTIGFRFWKQELNISE